MVGASFRCMYKITFSGNFNDFTTTNGTVPYDVSLSLLLMTPLYYTK